jgi:hypothetical protein
VVHAEVAVAYVSHHNKYATIYTEALHYPVRDPLRLLALGVLLRWAQDVREGYADVELDEEWIDRAEVRAEWIGEIAG